MLPVTGGCVSTEAGSGGKRLLPSGGVVPGCRTTGPPKLLQARSTLGSTACLSEAFLSEAKKAVGTITSEQLARVIFPPHRNIPSQLPLQGLRGATGTIHHRGLPGGERVPPCNSSKTFHHGKTVSPTLGHGTTFSILSFLLPSLQMCNPASSPPPLTSHPSLSTPPINLHVSASDIGFLAKSFLHHSNSHTCKQHVGYTHV